MTEARDSNNHYLLFGYDALGRRLSETSNFFSRGYQYDAAGRRTRLTHGDGFFVDYEYLTTGEMTKIRENGATSGVGVLATFGYDPNTAAGQLGLRTSLTRGNGTVTSYGYDPASRLTSLGWTGSSSNLALASTTTRPGRSSAGRARTMLMPIRVSLRARPRPRPTG